MAAGPILKLRPGGRTRRAGGRRSRTWRVKQFPGRLDATTNDALRSSLKAMHTPADREKSDRDKRGAWLAALSDQVSYRRFVPVREPLDERPQGNRGGEHHEIEREGSTSHGLVDLQLHGRVE